MICVTPEWAKCSVPDDELAGDVEFEASLTDDELASDDEVEASLTDDELAGDDEVVASLTDDELVGETEKDVNEELEKPNQKKQNHTTFKVK